MDCSSLGGQITPFASRTFQYTKEQLGQADDKVRKRRHGLLSMGE
jgi:hypothetical protein